MSPGRDEPCSPPPSPPSCSVCHVVLERPTIHIFLHDVAWGQRGIATAGKLFAAAGDVDQSVFERVRIWAERTSTGEWVVKVHFPHLFADPLHSAGEEEGKDGGFTCGVVSRRSRGGLRRQTRLTNELDLPPAVPNQPAIAPCGEGIPLTRNFPHVERAFGRARVERTHETAFGRGNGGRWGRWSSCGQMVFHGTLDPAEPLVEIESESQGRDTSVQTSQTTNDETYPVSTRRRIGRVGES